MCCVLLCLSSSTVLAKLSPTAKTRPQVEKVVVPDHEALGRQLPLWSGLPFVGILLSIAIIPMIAPVFWHHHFPKISIAWSLVLAVPLVIAYRGEAVYQLSHIVFADYIPFLILIGGLFIVSGGIYLKGTLVGKPLANTSMLLIGTVLASWMGTTGAAMLLIRPVIRANKARRYKVHTIVFFIFLVANIGGTLTPLGDPPLFLGFLRGVPFFWTLHLWPQMLMAALPLLVIYYVLDTILARKEEFKPQPDVAGQEKLSVYGWHNFLLLLGVVGAVLMSGSLDLGSYSLFGIHFTYQSTLRDILIVAFALVSLATTKTEHRAANDFSWAPIREVAILFFGIFITIVAPLLILRAGPNGAAAFLINMVNTPARFFWATGGLSSFLDNAPTYLTFFNLALGNLGINSSDVTAILNGQLHHPAAAQFVCDLTAISIGSVFMGAMTYIGNAPNFMVRSIAEESKIAMPSFLGYMIWSVGILIPIFVMISIISYVF
ncbi:MAG: sodium:proton antiporter [candidate division Zixibacteria bacterium]|nr:sodium:proton antiporter [candidate division Zixibacteria bacterium]